MTLAKDIITRFMKKQYTLFLPGRQGSGGRGERSGVTDVVHIHTIQEQKSQHAA